MVALLVKYHGASAVTYAVTMETTWSLIAVKEILSETDVT